VNFGNDTSGQPIVACTQGCAASSACRQGYACWPLSGGTNGMCWPRCGDNQDCAAGYTCSATTGICE
jgi:hypothetical protein